VFISVAAPVPALPLLTYRVPPGLSTPVRGARVLVPLGRRTVTGLVVGPAEGPPPDVVRDIERVLDEAPFVPDDVIDLALWIAEYYLASPGDALGAALPPFAWIESEPQFELTESARAGTADLAQMLDPLLARLARGHRPVSTGVREARKEAARADYAPSLPPSAPSAAASGPGTPHHAPEDRAACA